MQSAEGGEGVGEDERLIRPQERLDQTAEDSGATVLFEEQIEPQPDDSADQPHPDLSGADEDSPAVQDSFSQGQVTTQFSILNTSEDMEPLPEDDDEEALIILDPEHPVVRRQQAALHSYLKKQLEKLNLELEEKRAMEKTDASHMLEVDLEMFSLQETLARLHDRLEERHQTKAQSEAKRRHTQDQLEALKSHHSSLTGQHNKDKASVSQLQAEIDNLTLQLIFTQGASEDLRSNLKIMQNVKRKAGAAKDHAQEQTVKQEMYKKRLRKEIERLTEDIAMYEVQASAQAEETKATKEVYSEFQMDLESVVMMRKQLLQQWNSSLIDMRRRDEAFSVMQEAVREVEHQVILLDREIEGFKKSITEEQEQNETLTLRLNWSQMDGATSKRLISQKQAQQEALQAHYSTCLCTLRETERTLARLTKETSAHQTELNDQRRQLEKESALRLELEEKIMIHMQQKLSHTKVAKHNQQLISKIASLKKQKVSQILQLENEVVAVGLENSEVGQHLDILTLTQKAFDEEITKYNKLLTTSQAKISSFVALIGQKQATIANYNKRICDIAANTGSEDLSPLQIKIEALMAQTEELAANIKSDQQLWMKWQGTLVGLTQEIEANSKNMLKLQMQYTGMQQRKTRLEGQIEAENQEQRELEKKAKTLRGDLQKLKTQFSKNSQLSQALEQESALMETDILLRLKEAERESIELQMKCKKTQEERERLLNCLLEAEQQIMLWEKKTQLVKETRSVVDSEVGQGEIKTMKAEIHRMEVRLSQLMKQRERLLRESEAVVSRRENIVLHQEALVRSSRKKTTKAELGLVIQGLKRKIQNTHKHVTESEWEIKELHEHQESLSDKITEQKQQLIELRGTSYVLDSDIVNLQDAKEKNLANLVALQSRIKKLQEVCDGSYKALSTSDTVEAALQSQIERVHTISTIVHRVCEEFPQHQGALHRLSLALAARTQILDQEATRE